MPLRATCGCKFMLTFQTCHCGSQSEWLAAGAYMPFGPSTAQFALFDTVCWWQFLTRWRTALACMHLQVQRNVREVVFQGFWYLLHLHAMYKSGFL